MNESIESRRLGIEVRIIQLRPAELDHMAKYRTNKSFKSYVSANSIKPPRIQAQDILSIELEAQDSEKLPARMVVELARGHRDLGIFVSEHLDHSMEVVPSAETIHLTCFTCKVGVEILRRSLGPDR